MKKLDLKTVGTFLVLVIASIGCANSQKTTNGTTEGSSGPNTSVVVLQVGGGSFSLDSFADNPFLGAVFVPGLNGNSDADFFKGHDLEFVSNAYIKHMTDSDVPFLHLVHDGYSLEVWTNSKHTFFLRNSMTIENPKYPLKYGIVLGQDIGVTLETIKAFKPQTGVIEQFTSHYIIGEERIIHFIEEGGKLKKIEIQIGT